MIDKKDEKNGCKIEDQKEEDNIIQKKIEYVEGNISNPPPPRKLNNIKAIESKVNSDSKMLNNLNNNNEIDNILQRRKKRRKRKKKEKKKN